MDIVSRSEWDARPPRGRFLIATPTPKLYLHHTASPTGGPARVRAIQDFHMDVRGWSDIAYSFLVSAAGIVYEGRGPGVAGGHTAGQNTVSHAICAMGNYDTTIPSQIMLNKIRQLAVHGHAEGWWPAQFTGGHRDAPGASTSCPGSKLYPLIPELNQPLPPSEEDDMLPISPSSAREDIRSLQGRLNAAYNAGLTEDGVYGTSTVAAVKTHLGGFTGDPQAQQGAYVVARQWNGLLEQLIRVTSAGGSFPPHTHSVIGKTT